MCEARARFDRNGRITEPELQVLKKEQNKRLAEAQEIAEELTRSLEEAEKELAAAVEEPS